MCGTEKKCLSLPFESFFSRREERFEELRRGEEIDVLLRLKHLRVFLLEQEVPTKQRHWKIASKLLEIVPFCIKSLNFRKLDAWLGLIQNDGQPEIVVLNIEEIESEHR